jgi:hypothetical protein
MGITAIAYWHTAENVNELRMADADRRSAKTMMTTMSILQVMSLF